MYEEYDRIGPEAWTAAQEAAAAAIPKPNIIYSLPTLIHSGFTIREIVGYYGYVRKHGPACYGVKFVYGPQIEPDLDEKCTMSDRNESLANRFDLGFAVSNSLPRGRGYERKHWRLHVDEYITRVTLHIGRWNFVVELFFETNLNRTFTIGPKDTGYGRLCFSDVTVEYIIQTPPGYALIALTGTQGGHIHAVRGVYAAIRKPQNLQPEHHEEDQRVAE